MGVWDRYRLYLVSDDLNFDWCFYSDSASDLDFVFAEVADSGFVFAIVVFFHHSAMASVGFEVLQLADLVFQ